MNPNIALQLYTVREALAQDFAAAIRRVADLGYEAVETAGFPGTTPKAAARLFRSLGLTVCSAHTPLPLGEKQKEALALLDALDVRRAVCAWLPPERFSSLDSIRAAADELNQAAAVFARHDIAFHYHNHWFELWPVAGKPGLQHLLEHLDPAVLLELDIYWVKTGGGDPASLLRSLGRRVPLLHVKDGPGLVEAPMVALGEGIVDIPAALAAASADWLIVELDRCATDMFEAAGKSLAHLRSLANQNT